MEDLLANRAQDAEAILPAELKDSPKAFNVMDFLAKTGKGRTVVRFGKGGRSFAQGDGCDSVFYVHEGCVKLTVLSEGGKEATIALLTGGYFVGEECVSTKHPCRSATASAVSECVVLRISKVEMLRVLHEEHAMFEFFVGYLLARTNRIQADLVDQLFNSSERRLARTLLMLANLGEEGVQDAMVPEVSQATLAAMVGCTRSRVNLFLNRFRKLGYIEYDRQICVKRALMQVMLHD